MGDDKKFVQGKMEIAGLVGPLWLLGWLFTLGFTDVSFGGKAILALFLWPYYLGAALG
ncbi:MAG: hypothetical protein ABIA59_01470 [Candidatus Latescibacterota bacterium]